MYRSSKMAKPSLEEVVLGAIFEEAIIHCLSSCSFKNLNGYEMVNTGDDHFTS